MCSEGACWWATKRERRGVLYAWPLCVCENIICVGGGFALLLLLGSSLRGTSLIPRTISALRRSLEMTAPAC